MKILPINNIQYQYHKKTSDDNYCNKIQATLSNSQQISFQGSFFSKIQNYFNSNPLNISDSSLKYLQYKKAQKYADKLYNHIVKNNEQNKFIFRNVNMNKLEGLQYGIKVFEGMTMKEVQYTSEFLHVIAVKRGCTNMCGHCYASAKPSNRQMSFEDFKDITDGFKTIRERLHGLDIFGRNIFIEGRGEGIYKTTELFYDADCINIVLKDKNGYEHDFTELADITYNSLGRTTVFDTAGWDKNNKKLQERAEKYAQYYSHPKNRVPLEQFNVSFNTFNASYIASRKALKNGDYEKAKRLRERFLDNMANTLFTFTPVADSQRFNVLIRAFHPSAKNAKDFDVKSMTRLMEEVIKKLEKLYIEDLNGEQKYVKSKYDLKEYMETYIHHFNKVDTALNNSGRLKEFVKEHNIEDKRLQNLDEQLPELIKNLYPSDRLSKIIHQRLIDADGRVYYMDYARIIPTEIQLNISGKNEPTPKLGNFLNGVIITKENINYE